MGPVTASETLRPVAVAVSPTAKVLLMAHVGQPSLVTAEDRARRVTACEMLTPVSGLEPSAQPTLTAGLRPTS